MDEEGNATGPLKDIGDWINAQAANMMGLDGKPSDMNCSVMASKVGALAVGTSEADNTSEANGLIPPDKFCDNPSCLAHSFWVKRNRPCDLCAGFFVGVVGD